MTRLVSRITVLMGMFFAMMALPGCKEDSAVDASSCQNCGEIASIQPREVEGEASPAAAVAGAIIGGVVGHQFGSGSGNDAATACRPSDLKLFASVVPL